MELRLLISVHHMQGNFLTWHRYYVWAYEYALQNECGYNGTQPVSANLI